jgi:predicted RNA-binding protein with PUA-like domain
MQPQHWLVKSEPEAYSWATFARDKRTAWTGVRNYQARIHLNAMRPGDRVLFYESVGPKAVVGLAEVTKPSFPDTTADAPGWVAVELKCIRAFMRPVTLAQIKAEPLDNNDMIKSSRCAAHVEQLADAVRDFVCS